MKEIPLSKSDNSKNLRARISHQQIAAEYAAIAARSGAEMCRCGASRDEHDIAPDFTQPCERTGCRDFAEAIQHKANDLISGWKGLLK